MRVTEGRGCDKVAARERLREGGVRARMRWPKEVSVGKESAIERTSEDPSVVQWSAAKRVIFRLCFVYFGLFCLSTQILSGLLLAASDDFADPATYPPMRQMVIWTAKHVFRVKTELVYTGSGSGDKTFDWVLAFCLLVIAVAATIVWSAMDRRRANYVTLHKWFRVFIRFCLAGQMIGYGLAKAVPLQMSFPLLTKLVEHYGNLSPMGVLWSSIGASQAYEIFAGCAETLGGLLLIAPRTATLGALVCLADLTQVFMLNMTYDVPVKLFSFHLILLSVFLLAPEFSRLANVLALNRTAEPSTQPALFRTRRANRIALGAQIAVGIWIVGSNVYGSWHAWYEYGGARPKSALYGIWDVNEFTIDGQERAPLLTDKDRWRRVFFDFPEYANYQHMDESLAGFGAAIDTKTATIALTKRGDKNWKASLAYTRPADDRLTLDGQLDGHTIHMELQREDLGKFELVKRGFHWVQEYPYNR